MSDGCTCTLTLGGILKREHVPLLVKAMKASGYRFDTGQKDDLERGDRMFDFYDVNYGSLHEILEKMLISLKLSFTWYNDQGSEYGPSCIYYDARSNAMTAYNYVGDNIALTLQEIEEPNAVEKAKEWENFAKNLSFCTVSSNHEAIAKEASNDLPEGYIDLLPQVAPAAI